MPSSAFKASPYKPAARNRARGRDGLRPPHARASTTEISGPIIERIQRQRLAQQRRGGLIPAETPQRDGLEIASAKVVRASAQAHVEVGQRVRPIASPAVDLGQGVKAGSAPGRVPGRFVEGRVGFVVAPKETQGQAEIVESLAVVGIGIASEQTL